MHSCLIWTGWMSVDLDAYMMYGGWLVGVFSRFIFNFVDDSDCVAVELEYLLAVVGPKAYQWSRKVDRMFHERWIPPEWSHHVLPIRPRSCGGRFFHPQSPPDLARCPSSVLCKHIFFFQNLVLEIQVRSCLLFNSVPAIAGFVGDVHTPANETADLVSLNIAAPVRSVSVMRDNPKTLDCSGVYIYN